MANSPAGGTNEVAKTEPLYSMEQLADIKSLDDMMQLLADAGIQATEISEYGDGFEVCNDKRKLVNVPFGILDYKFSEKGDYGRFSIIRLVTKDGRKLIVTDGSSNGIHAQMEDLERRGVPGGVMCPTGIVVSEYTYVGVNPKTGEETREPGETFYFSMAKS